MTSYSQVKEQLVAAAKDCGRDPSDITLIAVSKMHTVDEILPVLEAGQRVFGENRVQEAKEKFTILKEKYPNLELHLIGHLQTNKVKDAVALFDVIETVDRIEVAEKLADEMKKQNRFLPCFIEVNTGSEVQKSGIVSRETLSFAAKCRELGLNIVGLMCIPPVDDEPAPHFALLKKLAKQLNLKELSMGMSNDFPIAVQLGATYVRVGTAIFGQRNYA